MDRRYVQALYIEAFGLYDRLFGAWFRETSIDTPRARRLARMGARANDRRMRRLRLLHTVPVGRGKVKL